MALTLSEQLEEMRLGDHLCLVYDNADEQMAAVVPYLKQGLARHEACIYITDDRTLEEVKAALTAGGIDVDAEIARGALHFATKRDAYLSSGSFDPDAMIRFLDDAVRGALGKGFTGYRITGEMTWALGKECGCERLIEYEAKLNCYFPGSKSTAICQYNRERFTPDIIRDVLRTHPVAIIGTQVCPNLYFEEPEIVLGERTADDRVDWMIGQLTRFHASEQRLKESIRARDEFLSVASHELKTPLTSLNIQMQLLNRAVASRSQEAVSSPNVAKRLEMAARQTKRMTALVDTLLDVSRVNASRVSLEVASTDVSSIVDDAILRISEEATTKGVAVALGRKDAVRAEVDSLRLEQVLANLLSNALKYGDGKPVSVDLEDRGASFRIAVRDSGMGIRKEDQARIFSRFERAVSGQNISGLGLGLYIACEIVKAHDGTISVESEPGKGSVFSVELPKKHVAAAEGAA